jgi:hypothetical protein
MKSLIQAVALAAALTVPVLSFAQSDAPVTRAQVRADLVQVEGAGYNPATANPNAYPSDVQAAEARLAAQRGQSTGYGGVTDGASAAGSATRAGTVGSSARAGSAQNAQSVYFGN